MQDAISCTGCGLMLPCKTMKKIKDSSCAPQHYCKPCAKLLKSKQYCGICKKIWHHSDGGDWVCCDGCNACVHAECDKISSNFFKDMENIDYYCPDCKREFDCKLSASQTYISKIMSVENSEKPVLPENLPVVGASLFRFIEGKGGSTQKMIEEEMRVKLMFPSSKEEDFITIEGVSIDSVTLASEKIRAIIDETVRSRNLDYSHFISLPLAIHPELVTKLINFQHAILGNDDSCKDENLGTDSNEDGDTTDNKEVDQLSKKNADVSVELKVDDDSKSVKVNLTSIPLVSYAPRASKSSASSDLGIDKSIFIKPKTFHLTVLMLKLWNKDRVKTATEVLQSISPKVMEALDNQPISIRLKGLECMKGSLAKARVLYAPVEEIGSEGRLLRACQVIIDAYIEAGLVLENDANQRLKLHATVMNSGHRKRTKWERNVGSFDARGIFKQYGSEDWGQYLISEAHLSQRFSFDENGYYHCCASIPFPENM